MGVAVSLCGREKQLQNLPQLAREESCIATSLSCFFQLSAQATLADWISSPLKLGSGYGQEL